MCTHQIYLLEHAYEICNSENENNLDRSIFDRAIKLCLESTVITDVKDGVAYQTLSLLHKQKDINEISRHIDNGFLDLY
jgi:hypothetical protein